jgi:hypothetical protein|tara:strand:- start:4955 stop:5119 length:165 start_codon:yes stop_codon:yes gene_type:complete
MEENEEIDEMQELRLRIDELEERLNWLTKKYTADLDSMIKVLCDLTGEPEYKFR